MMFQDVLRVDRCIMFFWLMLILLPFSFFFFFNDTATTEIYTLSLHDALPILCDRRRGGCGRRLLRRLGRPRPFRALRRGHQRHRPEARPAGLARRPARPDGRRARCAYLRSARRAAGGRDSRMTRRALVVEQPGSLAVLERDELQPGPSEVVIRPAYCGLCGTDLELLAGQVDPAFVRYPLTLGHEWSGRVEAVGERVTGLAPGQRCVAEGIIPCGLCASCLARATNICEIYYEVGFPPEGGAGDQILVPARVVHLLGESVSLLDAALVEPSAVVLTGLEKIRPVPGMRVVVIGDGTIALLAALLMELWFPAELVAAGRPAQQEGRGLRLAPAGLRRARAP